MGVCADCRENSQKQKKWSLVSEFYHGGSQKLIKPQTAHNETDRAMT